MTGSSAGNPAEGFVRLVIRKGAGAFAVRTGGSFVTFGSHLLLARLMGAEEYGVFVYAYSWIIFLSLTGKWGLDKVMVRYGAPHLDAGRRSAFHALFREAVRRGISLSAALALLLAASVLLFESHLEARLAACLALGAVWLPLIAAQRIHEGAAESFRNVFQATIPDYILRPGLLGLLACAHFVLFGRGPTAFEAVAYYTASLAGTLLVHRLWMARAWVPAPGGAVDTAERRESLAFGMHMTFINNVSYLLGQADVLIIGLLLTTTDAGVYSVISRMAAFAVFVSIAAFMVFAPTVAALHARGAMKELSERTRQVTVRVLLFTAFVAAGLAAVGPYVLAAFGERFAASPEPLMILLAGYVVRSGLAVAEPLLNMTGHQRVTLRIMALAAAFDVAFTFALLHVVPSVAAAAFATAVSTILCYLLLHAAARKRLFHAPRQDTGLGHNTTKGTR